MSRPRNDGAKLIAVERDRQILDEGWEAAHDDGHEDYQLARAAACYISAASRKRYSHTYIPFRWHWEDRFWKPTDRVRDLVKAGALIAAEIDRLLREQAAGEKGLP